MANINKSFNFRNGVQVDEDNFLVNSLGLVGIGDQTDLRLDIEFAYRFGYQFRNIGNILCNERIQRFQGHPCAKAVTRASRTVEGRHGRCQRQPTRLPARHRKRQIPSGAW